MKKQKFVDKVKYALENYVGLQHVVREYKAWCIICQRNPDEYRMKIYDGKFVIEQWMDGESGYNLRTCTTIDRYGRDTIGEWIND